MNTDTDRYGKPAAPVVWPEPFALYDGEKWYANEEAAICSRATMQQLNIQKLQKVFTEQQVRELLAQATCHQAQPVKQEPFGHFKCDAYGWMDCTETDEGARPLYEAPQPQADALDADFEAVRKKLCKLQRYSFWLDEHGGVRRVDDRCGNWIEFDAAHELFDPVAIDAAIAAAKEK